MIEQLLRTRVIVPLAVAGLFARGHYKFRERLKAFEIGELTNLLGLLGGENPSNRLIENTLLQFGFFAMWFGRPERGIGSSVNGMRNYRFNGGYRGANLDRCINIYACGVDEQFISMTEYDWWKERRVHIAQSASGISVYESVTPGADGRDRDYRIVDPSNPTDERERNRLIGDMLREVGYKLLYRQLPNEPNSIPGSMTFRRQPAELTQF